MKFTNYIVMEEVILNGSFGDYIEAAEELADELDMAVKFKMPYRRSFVVLPQEADDHLE